MSENAASSYDDVHLVIGKAPLLSGSLRECYNATDPTCVGGFASIAAAARFYSAASNHSSVLVLPFLDKSSPFVQMHPLGWSLNRYIFHRMHWKVFLSSPSILTQNRRDFSVSQRDISDLQDESLPLLLSNVAVPPGNSWFPFVEAIYFDPDTALAILVIDSSQELMNVDQIDSAQGLLDYIHRVNTLLGCATTATEEERPFFAYYDSFLPPPSVPSPSATNHSCWIPIVLFNHVVETWDLFLPALLEHEHPPALILNVAGSGASNFSFPTLVRDRVWVHSFLLDIDYYNHHVLAIAYDDSNGLPRIQNITFLSQDYKSMPVAIKDAAFGADITHLRQLADEALAHDPVVGYSGPVPVHRDDPYRRCMGGECELGNLFTDALRWRTGADVAFVTSGGLRGRGWPAGPVHVSNLWEALIFPNTVCTGRMTGVSLFQALNFSISMATFEGAETETGGYLWQVSGMRVTYNTQLAGSRLVAIDIYDADAQAYRPVERLRLYRFATDSFLCGAYEPFPFLLGAGLVFEGEEPGEIQADLHQEVVADYLSQLNGTFYDTSIQGRLVNDTSVRIPLNLIQNSESCSAGTYWNEKSFTCESCPTATLVNFLSERVELAGQTGSPEKPRGTIHMVNSDLNPVTLSLKSIPTWMILLDLRVADQKGILVPGQTLELQSGEKVTLELCAIADQLETGTAVASVAFGILNGNSSRFLGCTGQDVGFEIFMRVSPSQDLNQLGNISIMGFVMAAIVSFTACYFCYYVLHHKKLRIVCTMQPFFLVSICIGVFIMGLALIPLGLDDGIVSDHGADIACMSIPWLFSMGFTITQSALFSKLWRINKLFNSPQMRRMQVHEKDVLLPFALLFVLNFSILLVFTLVDPLQYERETVNGEIWNSYGHCTSNSNVGSVLFALNCCVNLLALLCACYQAYKARNVSDEFSESTNIGIAMFSWIQLVIVGIPVLFLIDKDNPVARYFILASLIFAVCESMLLFIFVPILLQVRQHRKDPECASSRSSRRSGGSSLVVQSSRVGETSSDQFHQQRIGRTRVSGLNFDIDGSVFSDSSKGKGETKGKDFVLQGQTIDEELDLNSTMVESEVVNPDMFIVDDKGEDECRC